MEGKPIEGRQNAVDDYPEDFDRVKIPGLEKERGDLQFRNGGFNEALKHYSKALMGVKILLETQAISPQEVATTYTKLIIVRAVYCRSLAMRTCLCAV